MYTYNHTPTRAHTHTYIHLYTHTYTIYHTTQSTIYILFTQAHCPGTVHVCTQRYVGTLRLTLTRARTSSVQYGWKFVSAWSFWSWRCISRYRCRSRKYLACASAVAAFSSAMFVSASACACQCAWIGVQVCVRSSGSGGKSASCVRVCVRTCHARVPLAQMQLDKMCGAGNLRVPTRTAIALAHTHGGE